MRCGIPPLALAVQFNYMARLAQGGTAHHAPQQTVAEGDVAKLSQTDAGLAAAVAGNTYTTCRVARTETERLNI